MENPNREKPQAAVIGKIYYIGETTRLISKQCAWVRNQNMLF